MKYDADRLIILDRLGAGRPCDDFNQCTSDDQCKPGDYDYPICEGTPRNGEACEYEYQCADGGSCYTYEGDYGDFTYCRGNPAPGVDCEDYNVCTADDKCVLSDDGSFAFCRGKPGVMPSNDHFWLLDCRVLE